VSVETVLSIIGFGLSVGAFVPLFFLKDRRREVAVVSLASIICAIAAWHALRWYHYDKELSYVKGEIVEELSRRDMTYEDIQFHVTGVESAIVLDAMHAMLRAKTIASETQPLHDSRGQEFQVRLYSTPPPER
jgi:hypothetical protein